MSQGVSVPGVSVQGVSVQGVNVQGVSVQGVSVQRVYVLGVSVQGYMSVGGYVPEPLRGHIHYPYEKKSLPIVYHMSK